MRSVTRHEGLKEVRVSRFFAKSRQAANVKGFGRRQAYESLRSTNPRAARGVLWAFRISVDRGLMRSAARMYAEAIG